MSKRKSEAWNHFRKINLNEAKCNKCEAQLSCKGSNTTGLWNHLKLHNVHNERSDCNDSEASMSNQIKLIKPTSSITNFLKPRESLQEILAKCAAKDGFSFNAIVHSEAIKGFVTSRNYNMPRSCNTIRKNILEFYEEKKMKQKMK